MHVYFPNQFDIFLEMAMRDSNSEPNQVWKWDLQPMCPDVFLLATCFFHLAKSLWNHGIFSVVSAV